MANAFGTALVVLRIEPFGLRPEGDHRFRD
jgi:hypothetical protein